jgi:hypothetical protein
MNSLVSQTIGKNTRMDWVSLKICKATCFPPQKTLESVPEKEIEISRYQRTSYFVLVVSMMASFN